MIGDIFETRRGVYQLDTETGLFTLDNRRSTPKRFLGSIDPSTRVTFIPGEKSTIDDVNPRFRLSLVTLNFLEGYTEGFTPRFVEGYRPFGITCEPEDIMFVGENVLQFSADLVEKLRQDDRSVKLELGSHIDRVYRQLTPEERGYRVVA